VWPVVQVMLVYQGLYQLDLVFRMQAVAMSRFHLEMLM
jgi:hypothetical protein